MKTELAEDRFLMDGSQGNGSRVETRACASKVGIVSCGFLILALLFALPVQAYVLPSGALFDLWSARRSRLKADTQQISGRLTVIDTAGVRHILPALAYMHFPGDCRLEIDEGADPKLAGQHVTVRANKLVAKASAPLELLNVFETQLCTLLGFREGDAQEVARRVKSLGIATDYTGLARLEDRTAFVLGAPAVQALRPGQTEQGVPDLRPALWLDKEKHLPVLLRKDGMELQLLGYSDPATGEWFPHELKLFVGKTLRLRFLAERVDQNVELDPELFRK